METDTDEDVPLAKRKASRTDPCPSRAEVGHRRIGSVGSDMDDTDTDEDVPLYDQFRKRRACEASERYETIRKIVPKRKRKEEKVSKRKKKSSDAKDASNKEIKWRTLEWKGLIFPPEYVSHGIRMLYDGKPIDLTKEQEEVATFFAVMRDTDYASKPTFVRNFWEGFKELLGPHHTIQKFELCDFTPIYDWHMAEREKKLNRTKEEKKRIREETLQKEEPYKWALVDGRPEQVGNFRIEPPGLFRGRGEHPKMGRIKRRIYPEDVTINIGKGAPVPECNLPGHRWGGIRHDNTVTWLAFWKDPVDPKQFKYVWMAANSTFKADSDRSKYEKARELKKHIASIRETYTRCFRSSDRVERMVATAVYLIDKLALRAGHEKDEDEADTVGCCNLKVENVECVPPSSLKFDFLGKDSIRYENIVRVEPTVYKNVESFLRVNNQGQKKQPLDQLFEFDVAVLNKWLKDFMDGLSAKVFRTYNASITLDRLLQGVAASVHLDGKLAEYNAANKEVAVLCNHQRAIPKTHDGQMERMGEKLEKAEAELASLHSEYKSALSSAENGTKSADPKRILERIARKQHQIDKLKLQKEVKEQLKTVALGTSKINYLDPRISVAWCKREEVPIEKIFNKSLLGKFTWAMEADSKYRF